jgi:hypothetical protein
VCVCTPTFAWPPGYVISLSAECQQCESFNIVCINPTSTAVCVCRPLLPQVRADNEGQRETRQRGIKRERKEGQRESKRGRGVKDCKDLGMVLLKVCVCSECIWDAV